MVEVISRGNNHKERYRVTCDKCGSLLEYASFDILNNLNSTCSTRTVRCPVCREQLIHSETHLMEG
jgi:phage FluMu protein Com